MTKITTPTDDAIIWVIFGTGSKNLINLYFQDGFWWNLSQSTLCMKAITSHSQYYLHQLMKSSLGSFWYWKLEVTKSLLLSEILINLVTDALGIKSKYMTFSSLTPPVASLMIWTNKFFRIHLLCRFRINLFKLCSSMNRLRHSHFFFLFNLFLQILL